MLPKPYSLIVLLLMGACYPERAQNATATTDVDTPPNQNESPNDRPVGARDGGLQNSSDAEQLDAGLPLGVPTTAEVYDNFAPLCSACHSSGQSFPIFASLTDFENLVVNNEDWIVAGNPQSSILLALLEGTSDGAYAQMPPGPNTYFDMTAGDATLLDRTALEQWITFLNPDSTSEAECWDAPAFRGLQRLTRTEYNNTVRDLLGDTEAPGNTFPADDYSHGFDNIAEVLTLSPLLVEKYELAAQSLIDNALTLESAVPIDTLEEAESLSGSVGAASASYWNLWSNGTLTIVFSVATEGDYTLSFRGGGQQAGPDAVYVNFLLNNQNVYGTHVPEAWPNANIYQHVVHLMPGTHSFGVEFTNDYYCPQAQFEAGTCDDQGDRNFHVDWLRAHGPDNPVITERPPQYDALITCEPTGSWLDNESTQTAFNSCADTIFDAFGKKAWRRPLSSLELSRLQSLAQSAWEEGDTFIEGIQLGFKAILLSPHFIFKVEKEITNTSETHRALDAYELATRLSYFLWSSAPDDSLLQKADTGELLENGTLQEEIGRMLTDTKAHALTNNFAAQWLLLRDIWNMDPEYTLYAEFDESLREAMYQESTLLFQHLLENDLPLMDLFTAEYSFINQRLAEHYGIEGDFSDAVYTQINDIPHRKGVLTHAGWLGLTSHRTRTSPVTRGKWILERLLCESPPPPPPGVEGLIDDATVDQSLPIRERMEQHRADPTCAACHLDMDAMGFAFENYDAIGSYRETDQGHPIDPSGSLLGETEFANGLELTTLLSAHPQVGSCLTEKMLIYALGRGLHQEEACMVEAVADIAAPGRFQPQTLIKAIAQHDMFQKKMNTPIAIEEVTP